MLLQPLPDGCIQIDAVTHTVSLLELAECISKIRTLPAHQEQYFQSSR